MGHGYFLEFNAYFKTDHDSFRYSISILQKMENNSDNERVWFSFLFLSVCVSVSVCVV